MYFYWFKINTTSITFIPILYQVFKYSLNLLILLLLLIYSWSWSLQLNVLLYVLNLPEGKNSMKIICCNSLGLKSHSKFLSLSIVL